MRRTIALLITVCICLGGLVYAHAAVTVQEEQLIVSPITEIGDISALNGRTATVDINCGDHLTWTTSHSFGEGITTTDFTFIQNPPKTESGYSVSNEFSAFLSMGMSASSTGSIVLAAVPGYSEMVKAVAAITRNGESQTMHLKLADYMDYYTPDYDLQYEDETHICFEEMNLYAMVTGYYDWTSPLWIYNRFMEHFRFPVREDTIVSVTVRKNEVGEVVGLSFQSENAPTLELIGSVDQNGVWFVPVFKMGNTPLDAELPDGMGIYFVPWKERGNTTEYYYPNNVQKTELTPDWENAVNVYSLSAETNVVDMEIENGEAWLMTQENDTYVLTVIDLDSCVATNRLELMAYSSQDGEAYFSWDYDERWMTVITDASLALVDLRDYSLALDAPVDPIGEHLYYYWEAYAGTMEFDGETLILANTMSPRQGFLWIAVFREEGLIYYGEYDCSIFRGNEYWYYDTIYASYNPITLQ